MYRFFLLLILAANISPCHKAMAQISGDLNTPGQSNYLPFQLFLPKVSPDKLANLPPRQLLVFLHGSGERGSDNKAQLKHGKSFFEQLARKHNTVVLVPQCPKDLSWHNGYSKKTKIGKKYFYPKNIQPNAVLDDLEKLIDSIASAENITNNHIKIGGLSMGGMGTLELLRRRPNNYQRAFVICGGSHRSVAGQIGQTPIWFFHGMQDKIVDPKYAKVLYRKLNRKEIETQLTLYPNVAHDSWELAFVDQELIPWLMQ